jgi:glycosyltransferase involved in cell wall biosynthesis
MKILFEVGSTAIGGAERVVLKLAKGLRRRFPQWGLDCVVLYEHGGLREEYEAAFDNLWPPPPRYADSGAYIANLVAEHGYQIVHCIDAFEHTCVAAQLCPRARFIQAVYPNVEKSPFAPAKDWDVSGYSAIVTEFKANLERLPKPGRSPHILRAIPNGIDTDFWIPGIDRRCVDVTWCARTDEEKGIQTALELVPLLCSKGLVYRIVTNEADGPQADLAALKAEHPSFSYASALPAERLRHLLQQTKFFLSTSTVEGMPATPLEAAACGCWVMGWGIDGLLECFAEAHCLIPPECGTVNFAEIIDEFLVGVHNGRAKDLAAPDSPGGFGRMRKIAEKYSLTEMIEKYVKLYQRLL